MGPAREPTSFTRVKLHKACQPKLTLVFQAGLEDWVVQVVLVPILQELQLLGVDYERNESHKKARWVG